MKQRTTTFTAGTVLALVAFGVAYAEQPNAPAPLRKPGNSLGKSPQPMTDDEINAMWSGPSAQRQLDNGDTAYQRGDYATAMQLWRPLADKGNASAQFSVGEMYYLGQGVSQDYAQAAMWYRRAAENRLSELYGTKKSAVPVGAHRSLGGQNAAQDGQDPSYDAEGEALLKSFMKPAPASTPSAGEPLEDGEAASQRGDYAMAMQLWRPLADKGNADAQIKIGNLFWNGVGVPKDYKQAINWWRMAADKGNAEAQTDLGGMYFDGASVPQDFVQAIAWYLKAANQGYRVAQDRIGAMYEKGQGVGQDFVQAHMWFNLAAGNEKDATLRGAWIGDRNEVAEKMTPAQIAEAQRMAREWVPK